MLDKYDREIKVGDKIIYAVREGSCGVALNDATVLKSEPDHLIVRGFTGKKFKLTFPERICLNRD